MSRNDFLLFSNQYKGKGSFQATEVSFLIFSIQNCLNKSKSMEKEQYIAVLKCLYGHSPVVEN